MTSTGHSVKELANAIIALYVNIRKFRRNVLVSFSVNLKLTPGYRPRRFRRRLKRNLEHI
jgi:hypothetical protein